MFNQLRGSRSEVIKLVAVKLEVLLPREEKRETIVLSEYQVKLVRTRN